MDDAVRGIRLNRGVRPGPSRRALSRLAHRANDATVAGYGGVAQVSAVEAACGSVAHRPGWMVFRVTLGDYHTLADPEALRSSVPRSDVPLRAHIHRARCATTRKSLGEIARRAAVERLPRAHSSGCSQPTVGLPVTVALLRERVTRTGDRPPGASTRTRARRSSQARHEVSQADPRSP